ncbi:MAG: hypothetical protein OEZ13_13220 [Spirochaetia bacterium]|nr:hypothetical protein [Spirochaetia bacterium]
MQKYLFQWTIIFLFFLSSAYDASSLRKKRKSFSQEKIIINIDGGIGIGFYETSPGANSGGPNLNIDLMLFNVWKLYYGPTTGYLNLSENKQTNMHSKSIAIPTGLILSLIFEKSSWNSIPYMNFAPSLYFIQDKNGENKEYNLGIGASVGLGIMIPISSKIFIDLAMRSYFIYSQNNYYRLLSSNLGVCVVF